MDLRGIVDRPREQKIISFYSYVIIYFCACARIEGHSTGSSSVAHKHSLNYMSHLHAHRVGFGFYLSNY